jgi:hypothetical protein
LVSFIRSYQTILGPLNPSFRKLSRWLLEYFNA